MQPDKRGQRHLARAPNAAQRQKPVTEPTTVGSAVADRPVSLSDAADDNAIVTGLLLAGEQLALPFREPDRLRSRAPHAVSSRDEVSTDDFGWLVDIARHAAMRLAERPDRPLAVSSFSDALGDGEALALLFGRFLPGRKPPMCLDAQGRPILTPRQVDLLREASQDLPQSDIAERLGISQRTVSTHMERIYRRLGVNKPMQAVAKAVALGYLDLDAVGFVRAAANRDLRDFSTFHRFLAQVPSVEAIPGGRSLRQLAQFGLLLMLAAASAGAAIGSDASSDAPMVGVVCRLDPSGRLLTAFGGDRLREARGLTIAPPHSAAHGFRPGAVYVINESLSQYELNTGEIVEYVADGTVAPATERTFTGAVSVETRLTDARSLAFDGRGRLLVTSGPLTEAILAFDEGGARVSRFAPVRAEQLAVSGAAEVYAAGGGPRGSHVVRIRADGSQETVIASAGPDARYAGLAASGDGTILVNRVQRGRGAIEAYSPDGQPLRMYAGPGIGAAQLATDSSGRIYVPCRASCDIKVLSSDCRLEERIPLESIVSPYAVAVGPDGSIWVSGQAE